MVIDSDYAAAQIGTPELVLHASDPRLYEAGKTSTLKMVPTIGESVTLKNGTEETRPIVVFNGAGGGSIKAPKITNTTIAGEPFIELVNPAGEPAVKAGDQLLVDFSTPHRITYYPGGIVANKPEDAADFLTASSTWWDLIPNNNVVKFSSADPADTKATATIEWAPAQAL
jgi:hypothetical protein